MHCLRALLLPVAALAMAVRCCTAGVTGAPLRGQLKQPLAAANRSIHLAFSVGPNCTDESGHDTMGDGACCYDCFGFYGMRLTASATGAVVTRDTFGEGNFNCTGKPTARTDFHVGKCYEDFNPQGVGVVVTVGTAPSPSPPRPPAPAPAVPAPSPATPTPAPGPAVPQITLQMYGDDTCKEKSDKEVLRSGKCCYDCFGFWALRFTAVGTAHVRRDEFGEFDFNCTGTKVSTKEYTTHTCEPNFNPQGYAVEFSVAEPLAPVGQR